MNYFDEMQREREARFLTDLAGLLSHYGKYSGDSLEMAIFVRSNIDAYLAFKKEQETYEESKQSHVDVKASVDHFLMTKAEGICWDGREDLKTREEYLRGHLAWEKVRDSRLRKAEMILRGRD
jgi:hypothetical protein